MNGSTKMSSGRRARRVVIPWVGVDVNFRSHSAEDYARRGGAAALVDPAAPWRAAPATERQVATLGKWRLRVPPGLTRGEVSDLLAVFAGAAR
jgi:hypothetical protein